MNANTAIRKALNAHRACFSFKGHDFYCVEDRRYVKKVTNRVLDLGRVHVIPARPQTNEVPHVHSVWQASPQSR